VTRKLDLAVGLGFFQLRVHSFILYICPFATDAYSISKTASPNSATKHIRISNSQK